MQFSFSKRESESAIREGRSEGLWIRTVDVSSVRTLTMFDSVRQTRDSFGLAKFKKALSILPPVRIIVDLPTEETAKSYIIFMFVSGGRF